MQKVSNSLWDLTNNVADLLAEKKRVKEMYVNEFPLSVFVWTGENATCARVFLRKRTREKSPFPNIIEYVWTGPGSVLRGIASWDCFVTHFDPVSAQLCNSQ